MIIGIYAVLTILTIIKDQRDWVLDNGYGDM